ncbi:putative glycerophosphocholine phosphodiesterase GPCPD1 homolog 2 isoform X2 [Littorina saxatilis]|uniref:Glycerophosphocholine phosphodiesterase GPCPD1 n=1 Tax=Littorina saxatilis TaxID=31220 RepID=A0AAN9AX54_9CAEN
MAGVRVQFSVREEMEYGESMYVVGDCPALGQWKAQKAVLLKEQTKQESAEDEPSNMVTWEGAVVLPKNTNVAFRFFIGKMIRPRPGKLMEPVIEVILWETNIQPRQILTPDFDDYELPLATFGSYDGSTTMSQGWLENQMCVQVRFHNNPIFMWKSKHRSQLYSIKCSPLDYELGVDGEDSQSSGQNSFFLEDSSLEGPPPCDRTAMMYYNLNQGELKPARQPPQGCLYKKDDYLVFTSRGFNQMHLGFQLDFFVHEKTGDPRFVGSAHLLPPKVERSLFSKRVPIIGLNHRPIGEIQVETLRITPLPIYDWKMDVSYQNHWKWRKDGATLNVGHRGMGSSYKRVANVKENTICSLFSAAQHGADFVEFDVLLTKDRVPVIYHDFSICLSTAKKAGNDKELLEVAVKDLCLSNLQHLKLFHRSSTSGGSSVEVSEDITEEDQLPFPTLQRCLQRVDQHLGFNIEIKYPQNLENGECEMENYFDLNVCIDRILDVILKHAGERKIVFSTFHADTCIMVNLKQNKYPVLFLTNGPTQRYTPYSDWRCTTFQHGISFAKAEGLLGVNLQAEGLLQDLSLIPHIQSLGLVLFVWGEDLNEEPVKQTLRNYGVDAIIFDRIGNPKPENFMCESNSSLLDLRVDLATHKAREDDLISSSGTCIDNPASSTLRHGNGV